MNEKIANSKCAVVIDESLPTGLAANAASVITMTLGRQVDTLVGPDVKDSDGTVHAGIVLIPVPILTAPPDRIRAIRDELVAAPEAVSVDFTSLAQSCRRRS